MPHARKRSAAVRIQRWHLWESAGAVLHCSISEPSAPPNSLRPPSLRSLLQPSASALHASELPRSAPPSLRALCSGPPCSAPPSLSSSAAAARLQQRQIYLLRCRFLCQYSVAVPGVVPRLHGKHESHEQPKGRQTPRFRHPPCRSKSSVSARVRPRDRRSREYGLRKLERNKFAVRIIRASTVYTDNSNGLTLLQCKCNSIPPATRDTTRCSV